MDDDVRAEWNQRCRCGKRFYQQNSYSNHIKGCKAYKQEVGSSLETAKARWAKSEKGKKGKLALSSWFPALDDLDVDHGIPSPGSPSVAAAQHPVRSNIA